MVISGSRYADASCFGETFQTGCDIDSVPQDLLSILNYVSKVNTDAKLHPAVLRQPSISGFQFLLNFGSTLNCIHYTCKLSKNIIPWSIHYPSEVILNEARHHFFVSIQGADCPFLILTHEAAVPLNIGAEDGCEFTFNFLGGHGIPQRSVGRLVLKNDVI